MHHWRPFQQLVSCQASPCLQASSAAAARGGASRLAAATASPSCPWRPKLRSFTPGATFFTIRCL